MLFRATRRQRAARHRQHRQDLSRASGRPGDPLRRHGATRRHGARQRVQQRRLRATIPNGRIVRLDGNKATKFVDLEGVDHVWALAFDAKQNALYAATGPHGKTLSHRCDRPGAGLFRQRRAAPRLARPRATTAPSTPGRAARRSSTRSPGPGARRCSTTSPAKTSKGSHSALKESCTPSPTNTASSPKSRSAPPAGKPRAPRFPRRAPSPAKGPLTKFDADGRPEKLLRRDDTHFVSLAVGDDGRPYVGTGAEGRVYAVDDAHTSMLVADTDERQVGAMLLTGPKRFIATSDPAVFHEVRGIGGPDAVWTSKVLDAGMRAHFGRLILARYGPRRNVDPHRQHAGPRQNLERVERPSRRAGQSRRAPRLASSRFAAASRAIQGAVALAGEPPVRDRQLARGRHQRRSRPQERDPRRQRRPPPARVANSNATRASSK